MLASVQPGRSGISGGTWFLDERHDTVARVDMHDAQPGRVGSRHFDAGDRDVGAIVDVLDEHALVVHLVDVIAGDDDQVLGPVAVDDVDVLEHGVGGAGIPLVGRHALARWEDVEAFVAHGCRKLQPRCRCRIRLCLMLRRHRCAERR
jgi:hypothetical protein